MRDADVSEEGCRMVKWYSSFLSGCHPFQNAFLVVGLGSSCTTRSVNSIDNVTRFKIRWFSSIDVKDLSSFKIYKGVRVRHDGTVGDLVQWVREGDEIDGVSLKEQTICTTWPFYHRRSRRARWERTVSASCTKAACLRVLHTEKCI